MSPTGTLVAVRIGVLGTVDGPSGLSGVRLRGLLARLALDAGRPVSTAALVDGLWETPPENAANALQALVSRLRRSLGELVVTEPGGYRLAVEPRAVDAVRSTRWSPGRGRRARRRRTACSATRWRSGAARRWPTSRAAVRAPGRGPARGAAPTPWRSSPGWRCGWASRPGSTRSPPSSTPPRCARPRRRCWPGRCTPRAARPTRSPCSTARSRCWPTSWAWTPARSWPKPGWRCCARRSPPRSTAGLPSFVGRAADVERIRTLLRTARLVTLTGPGGAGKTRLAREARSCPRSVPPPRGRRRAVPRLPSAQHAAPPGAVVAELAALTEADQLPPAVLPAVGEPGAGACGPTPRRPTPLDPAAGRARPGATRCWCWTTASTSSAASRSWPRPCSPRAPRLRVLATSREPLGVTGEVLHPVDALRRAPTRCGCSPTAPPPCGPVSRWRRRRARRRRDLPPRWTASRCPSSWPRPALRTLSPPEIAARLDDRFRLLTSGVAHRAAAPPDAARGRGLELGPAHRGRAAPSPAARRVRRRRHGRGRTRSAAPA